MSTPTPGLRLDVWLYRARFFKTRSLATGFIEKGKVRLTRSGQTRRVTKPGFRVSSEDRLTFLRGTTLFQIEIIAMPARRGPAPEARDHYRISDTQISDINDG